MSTHAKSNKSPHFNWMAQTPELKHLRIPELILPGSHNSGCDKQSPNFSLPQEIAQDLPAGEQLENGIRVLDLRVAFYSKYSSDDPRRFQLFHRTSSGRTVAVDVIQAVIRFFDELDLRDTPTKEIVILDFHQFSDFTNDAHEELGALLSSAFAERLISYRLSGLSLEQLWQMHPGRNIVIAYNYSLNGSFWSGVKQRWPGSNLYNTNTLSAFIKEVSGEIKPNQALHAVQCAKYTLPFHAPTDLSESINKWFKSVDENSYIQNFYIINTDWSLRSELVVQCKHANAIRARRKLSHPDESLQPELRPLNRA